MFQSPEVPPLLRPESEGGSPSASCSSWGPGGLVTPQLPLSSCTHTSTGRRDSHILKATSTPAFAQRIWSPFLEQFPRLLELPCMPTPVDTLLLYSDDVSRIYLFIVGLTWHLLPHLTLLLAF